MPPDAPRDVPRDVPAGYVALDVRGARVVCRADAEAGVREALAHDTLHAWAARHPARRELRGRAAAYAVPLPDSGDVVVRHSWHGGLLARLTRDRFLAPTRAPGELATALRLHAAGVRTPEVVAYAVYPAGGPFRRADVVTRLVPASRDLAAAIVDDAMPGTLMLPDADAASRLAPWVRATGALLHALARAGARHPDLNLKNVLLADPAPDAPPGTRPEAWVIDVDVVHLARGPVSDGEARRVAESNFDRLARSLRKWRDARHIALHDVELEALREYARRGPDAPLALVWRPRNSPAHAS